ncbi:MAG: hypothetical protein J0L75_12500 [Spirochaetes bacterium]|nr:hypothetical protein [Spirochaetota bacterium]
MKQTFKAIWKDPVGSKLIAMGIVAAIGAFPLLFSSVRRFLANLIGKFNLYHWAITFLSILVLALTSTLIYLLLSRRMTNRQTHPKTPTEKYFEISKDNSTTNILVWFLYHKILVTEQFPGYSNANVFQNFPETKRLLDAEILTTTRVGRLGFRLEINSEIYELLSKEVDFNKLDEEIVNVVSSRSFGEAFSIWQWLTISRRFFETFKVEPLRG